MSHWNHRIIATDEAGEVVFRIHEVFYSDDGKPTSWTEDPVLPCGDSPSALRFELNQLRMAFFKPALRVQLQDGIETLSPEPDDAVVLDEFHRHEALDRTAVFMDQFESHVASHPAISYDPELCKLAEGIVDRMAALYQAVGR